MTKSVAVLGCGPSGLAAVHAAARNGWSIAIFSAKRKSQLYGSQYLHAALPGIHRPDDAEEVMYITRGTPEDYRRKTHGKAWDGVIAPEDFETNHKAWNIREAYDRLWQLYSDDVMPLEIDGNVANLDAAVKLDRFDLVVSSLPRTVWTRGAPDSMEKFVSSRGWALGDAPEDGKFVPYRTPNNTIICDGTDEYSYNRLSKVFGYTTVEWPEHVTPPIPGVASITKPLRYVPGTGQPADQFIHVGRYGTWTKGVLVTDAFDEVDKETA